MSVLSQFFGGGDQIPIEVFAVGGGGGGWGGGGGQVIYRITNAKFGTTYPIVIGAGGAFPEGNGVPTILTNILTAGGGGDFGGSARSAVAAVALTNFVDTGFNAQNPGGANGTFGAGGGGGGAGGAGGAALTNPPYQSGRGGNAIPGAAIGISTFTFSSGGSGIPGAGPIGPVPFPGVNGGSGGTNGSGSGGGLIIRYPTEYSAATVIGNTTDVPAQPGYYVYRWTSGPGSITFNR